jgi:hypothetical protein
MHAAVQQEIADAAENCERVTAVREVFRSGEQAPCSGIYKAAHAQRHTASHYVVALHGDTFPTCLDCRRGVRFELALHVVYVKADPQFVHLHDARDAQFLDL